MVKKNKNDADDVVSLAIGQPTTRPDKRNEDEEQNDEDGVVIVIGTKKLMTRPDVRKQQRRRRRRREMRLTMSSLALPLGTGKGRRITESTTGV
jgi:hypothetical protein